MKTTSRETTVHSSVLPCPQLALPMNSDVILCLYVCVSVRLCGILRLTKGSHSHPLASPHPRVVLRGLQPRGVDAGEGHFSYVNLD